MSVLDLFRVSGVEQTAARVERAPESESPAGVMMMKRIEILHHYRTMRRCYKGVVRCCYAVTSGHVTLRDHD